MQDVKVTKISIKSDRPIGIASEMYGANVGGMAFNLSYISRRDPLLAIKIERLYEKAKKLYNKPELSSNDPIFEKAWEEQKKLLDIKDFNLTTKDKLEMAIT